MGGWNHSKIGIQDASEHHENNSSSKFTWCPSACFTKKGLGPCTGTNTCIWKAQTPTKCKIQKLCVGWIGQTRNFLNYVELMQNNGHEPDKLITRHGTRSKGTEGDILSWQCTTSTNQTCSKQVFAKWSAPKARATKINGKMTAHFQLSLIKISANMIFVPSRTIHCVQLLQIEMIN